MRHASFQKSLLEFSLEYAYIHQVNAHSFFKTVIFDTLSGRSQRGFQLLSGRRTDAAEFRHCPHDTQELPVLSL